MSNQLPPTQDLARQRFVESLPSYQRYESMELVRQAARLLKRPGDMVIYRDAFRWKNDADNSVLSNHYEMFCIETLASAFNYEVLHDFNHVAVVTDK